MKSLCLGAVLLCTGALILPVQANDTLTILHTNDFHARYEPIKESGAICTAIEDENLECGRGAARLATLIQDRRSTADNSLLLDAGDQFQGSVFYTYYKDEIVAEVMNALGYDAMAVGNHEFDDGPETLGAFARAANFPVLLANADYSDDPYLSKTLQPSAVVQVGKNKVGLIGIAPDDTGEQPSAGPNVSFLSPIPVLNETVSRLQAEGINRIILISHSGYELDREIAAAVPGIDVIVGGNSNTVLSNALQDAEGPYPTIVEAADGTRTAIVQAGSLGKYLGELTVTFDDNGHLLDASGDLLEVASGLAKDPEVEALIESRAEPLATFRNEVIATLTSALDGSRETCRARECSMGNLLADASVYFLQSPETTIAIQSGGGLRASLEPGDVTRGDILSVLPFQNTIATLRLSGADIVSALENGVSRVEENAGRFPQVSGLRFSWTPSAEPAEGRIRSVEVLEHGEYVPLDPDRIYRIATNSFMVRGGDGYSVFAEKGRDITDEGISLDLVVSDYLAALGEYTGKVDGRITQN